MYMHAIWYRFMHGHKLTHSYTQSLKHMFVCVLVCLYKKHAHTHIHTNTHAFMHAHIYIPYKLTVILIWQSPKGCQINLRHYQSIYTRSMGFLHAVMKSVNLKSHQQRFLSKPPNIMFTYISADSIYACIHIHVHAHTDTRMHTYRLTI